MVSEGKKICIVTGTRAEYGLLRPLITTMYKDESFILELVVTGMHLCSEFGNTYQEIDADGLISYERIDMQLASDTMVAMTKSVGVGLLSFADYFNRKRPDLLIVLGDRYEIFACASAAALSRIPIAHLYGGDTTEGLIDEFIRHSITKMAQLHFVSNEESRKRVIQLGENPSCVFNVGALSVENALKTKLYSRQEVGEKLGLVLNDRYALMTFHPVTLEGDSARVQLNELFKAIEEMSEYTFIVTKANADSQGRVINAMLEEYARTHVNFNVYASLGIKHYISAMKYAAFVIGNSSSGLYETPSFGVPCVNIGDRQRGRMRAENVIDCAPESQDILAAMQKAVSPAFTDIAKRVKNPFGDGNTSERVLEILKKVFRQGRIDVKKEFQDIPFNI